MLTEEQKKKKSTNSEQKSVKIIEFVFLIEYERHGI